MGNLNSYSDLIPIQGTNWRGVRYGCTTRQGGVSEGPWKQFNLGLHTDDDPSAVNENRRRLTAVLPNPPFWLEQVHGINVVDADVGPIEQAEGDQSAGSRKSLPVGDAAITTQPGRVLAIMSADCAPVVIADVDGSVLGIAHAGWRGLAGGVLAELFTALKERCPAAAGWRAWIGPCIAQASFEVGMDVYQAFVQPNPNAAKYFLPGIAPGKWHADLAGLAKHCLGDLGVSRVEVADLCTFERDELFYSYRRSATTGRMATLAWLDTGNSAS